MNIIDPLEASLLVPKLPFLIPAVIQRLGQGTGDPPLTQERRIARVVQLPAQHLLFLGGHVVSFLLG